VAFRGKVGDSAKSRDESPLSQAPVEQLHGPILSNVKALSQSDQRHFEAAQGWLILGNLIEANEDLDNITPLMRAHPDVLALRWAICAKAGKWEAAFEIARTLVQFLPDDASSWLKQAESLRKIKEGGAKAALESLLPIAHRFQDSVVLLYSLACYSCQAGDRKAAWKWLECAMDKGGDRIKLLALDDKELEPLWADISEV